MSSATAPAWTQQHLGAPLEPRLSKIAHFSCKESASANAGSNGERGYRLRWEAYDGERFNKHHGITDAQVGAMLTGSMFGFDCPGADPLNHY